jgi:hypothetical protein
VATGQGEYFVPYSGSLTGVALQTRTLWQLYVDDELSLEVLLYRWIDGNGVEVVRLYATNDPETTNFDSTTYAITGASRLLVLADD